MRIGCIVLAAGRSERFGGNKLTRRLAGVSVLERTLSALPKDAFAKIIAVTADPETAACCTVAQIAYAGGPLSESIRVGMGAMGDMDGCMFVNGDQPLLREASIRRLAEAFRKDAGKVYRLCFGNIQASPVIFPKACFGALMLLTGEQGGMYAAKRCGMEIGCVEAECEAELWDVDTPRLMEAAETYLREGRRA